MILEKAIIHVTPGSESDFERALDQAKDVIAQSPGFRSLKLLRGIEEPSTFLILNEWDALEDHTRTFRESDLYAQWRAFIGPYFSKAPEVEHFDTTTITRSLLPQHEAS